MDQRPVDERDDDREVRGDGVSEPIHAAQDRRAHAPAARRALPRCNKWWSQLAMLEWTS